MHTFPKLASYLYKVIPASIFLTLTAANLLPANVGAISFLDLNSSLNTGAYSVDSYPRDTVTVEVTYVPETEDLYKTVYIMPIISKNNPGYSPYLESSWSNDTDFLVNAKKVQPINRNPITVSFQQPLVTRGANYIGCFAFRSDYNPDVYNYGSYDLCRNAPAVVYSGTRLPVWRFYSPVYESHFMTISHVEKAEVANYDRNWRYEKPAFIAHTHQYGQSGNTALYRFWSKTKKSHFYTANPSERDDVIRNYSDDVWKYEKVAFYVQPYRSGCTAGTQPVFRFWSKTKQSHFYTKSLIERDEVIRNYSDDVWKYEGPKFCAW